MHTVSGTMNRHAKFENTLTYVYTHTIFNVPVSVRAHSYTYLAPICPVGHHLREASLVWVGRNTDSLRPLPLPEVSFLVSNYQLS